MSDIHFDCPECGHNLVVDESGAGLAVPCPECSYVIKIPVPKKKRARNYIPPNQRPPNRKATSPQNSVQYCPNGHGLLEIWEGSPRCFVCGWPQKTVQTPRHSRSSSSSNAGAWAPLQILLGAILIILYIIVSVTSDEPITLSDDQKFLIQTHQLNQIQKSLKK